MAVILCRIFSFRESCGNEQFKAQQDINTWLIGKKLISMTQSFGSETMGGKYTVVTILAEQL